MSGRPQRLSANVPRHYLFDREWRAMPDDARTLWVSICQMCIGETDGTFTETDLGLMLPVDAARRQAALEWLLASRGAFRAIPHTRDGGGWRVPSWTDHNSTVATVNNHRRKERVKKAKARKRGSQAAPDVPGGTTRGDQRLKAKGFALKVSNHSGTLTAEQRQAIVRASNA